MKRQVFQYGKLKWLVLGLSVVVVSMLSIGFSTALSSPRASDITPYVYLIPVMAVFVVFGLSIYRDVEVTELGVRRIFFGLKCRAVPWTQIVSVRCGPMSPKDGAVSSYHLRTRAGSLFGGVAFMCVIDDVDRLVDLVAVEVANRGIPVSAWDVNTLVQVDKLPPPRKGAAAWT